MLRYFRQIVIGGEFGSRESAWALALLLLYPTWFAMTTEAAGVAMTSTWGFLTLVWGILIPVLVGAHIAEKAGVRGALNQHSDEPEVRVKC